MPYRSAAQRGYLHVHEPALAARWDRETGGKIVPKGGTMKGNPKMAALANMFSASKTKSGKKPPKRHSGGGKPMLDAVDFPADTAAKGKAPAQMRSGGGRPF